MTDDEPAWPCARCGERYADRGLAAACGCGQWTDACRDPLAGAFVDDWRDRHDR